jgi:hypothetical protein
MNVYQGSAEEDLLVLQWWARLMESKEMEFMFATPHTPASLLRVFQPPNIMLYEPSDTGFWFVAWFEPSFTGAFFSIWVAPEKRKSTYVYEAFLKAADSGFQNFDTLLGVTKQEHLLEQHKKVGYTHLCTIPRFFNGQDAYLVMLDKEAIRGRIRKHRRWRSEQWLPEWLVWERSQSDSSSRPDGTPTAPRS